MNVMEIPIVTGAQENNPPPKKTMEHECDGETNCNWGTREQPPPKKTMEHECDGDTNCNWGTREQKNPKKLWNMNVMEILNYDNAENGQNTEKSPGD